MSDLQTVATYSSVAEAQIASAYLVAQGIRAMVPDAHTAANLSYMTPLFGGVRVLVPTSELETARTLLGKLLEFRLVDAPEGLDELEAAPRIENEIPSAEFGNFAAPDSGNLRRAFQCAVVGLIIPFLPSVMSFYYLGRYLRQDPLAQRNLHFWVTVFLNLFFIAFFSVLVHRLKIIR